MQRVKTMNFMNYTTDGFYDEFFSETGMPREYTRELIEQINQMNPLELKRRQKSANAVLKQLGITFGVYGQSRGHEKIFPFDLIPRIIDGKEWSMIERGLKQRVLALNEFVQDIYNEEKILKDNVVPRELVYSSSGYHELLKGFTPPNRTWIHITGTDLIRDNHGDLFVLEDNMRCPSGISYVLANRGLLKKTFPSALQNMNVLPVSDYCTQLYRVLEQSRPKNSNGGAIVILTPGIYNSAYYEHSYLAQQMGIELVEARDLSIYNNNVVMRKTTGYQKVDVIYRRIDDEYIDPLSFKKDSMLGVPGLMNAYLNGRVTLVNAPGTGIADDKAIYAYVPHIIKYYLREDAILQNVPTYLCSDDTQKQHVLNNLDSMVVKATNLAGGSGMLMGKSSTKAERAEFAELIMRNPRNYIAQPTINLSRVPTLFNDTLEGRHVDFRPYILCNNNDCFVLPGGLTRVALKKGSLVVNSSQGGGSKDTWVLR